MNARDGNGNLEAEKEMNEEKSQMDLLLLFFLVGVVRILHTVEEK